MYPVHLIEKINFFKVDEKKSMKKYKKNLVKKHHKILLKCLCTKIS